MAQVKGSARLLHLSLLLSRLEVGERFDEATLKNWLTDEPGPCWLLYPEDAGTALPMTGPGRSRRRDRAAAAARGAGCDLAQSWRMLCHNPALQRLPRLALRDPPPSTYTIRKARRVDQLSTLEAACLALQQLEAPVDQRYAPLRDAFDGFVAELAAHSRMRSG